MWVRLDDQFWQHPKIIGLSDGAFRLHVQALCYANANLTDGLIPRGFVVRAAHSNELVAALVWEVTETGWTIHDYLEFQPTRAEVEELRAARADAGRRGGLAKAKQRASKLPSKDEANLYPVPDPVPRDVGITPLPPVQVVLLERLHSGVRLRVFGGTNAPDVGWCADLIGRGATESDVDYAVDQTATRGIRGNGAMNYCRAVLEGRVKEREAGRDPDAERSTGAGRSDRDGVSGQAQRGGFRVVGAGRAPRARVQGFDSSHLPRAIGEDDEEWYREHPEDRPAAP